MNARIALAAVALSSLGAVPVSATVLSATHQAVGTRSQAPDYLQVTRVQKEMNLTLDEYNGSTVASGVVSVPAPSTADGGFTVVIPDGPGATHWTPEPWRQTVDSDGPVDGRVPLPVFGGKDGGNIPFGQIRNDHGRRGGHGRHGDFDQHDGGAHAAPEPSTWMLLGTGLLLMGGYATIRRRSADQS